MCASNGQMYDVPAIEMWLPSIEELASLPTTSEYNMVSFP